MTRLAAIAAALLLALASTTTDQGQGGDQFLDGIGETGLVARYVLDGNAEDSSRNQFHADAARHRRQRSSRIRSSAACCC